MAEAIDNADPTKMLEYADLESMKESQFLIQCRIPIIGDEAFETYTSDFLNEQVVSKLRTKIDSVSLYKRVRMLTRCDSTGYLELGAPVIYEYVFRDMLVDFDGVIWLSRDNNSWTPARDNNNSQAWTPSNLKLDRMKLFKPAYDSMDTISLYHQVSIL